MKNSDNSKNNNNHNKKATKSRVNSKRIFGLIAVLLIVVVAGTLVINLFTGGKGISASDKFIGANALTVEVIQDIEKNTTIDVPRGTAIKVVGSKDIEETKYSKIKFELNGEQLSGYILESNVVNDIKDVATEQEMYVRTATHIYKDTTSGDLLEFVDKGTKLSVSNCELDTDGTCKWYQVKQGDVEGYVRGKYTTFTEQDSLLNYDPTGFFTENNLTSLDFYPRNKPVFKDKPDPTNLNTFYLTAENISKIDEFIEIAKQTNVNAFVVDIKESTHIAYQSPVAEKISETWYNSSSRSMEKFAEAIKKLKDEGYYVIGRIVVFNDEMIINDHPDVAIIDNRTGKPYTNGKQYFTSVYSRDVWQYNVDLAKEAAKEFGLDEIQFDYIRFPDRVQSLDANNTLNYHNKYNEEKAQAVQRFAMYATDELHELGVYVSGDVFGEIAMNVKRPGATAYGQQWMALSNVFDVISPMPYPDHFDRGNLGVDYPWMDPYKTMYNYHVNVGKFQSVTPSPAIVRTWIQIYETWKKPAIPYNASAVEAQIQGIYDAGFDGYMTWHTSAKTVKYTNRLEAFQKEYVKEEYKESFNYKK